MEEELSVEVKGDSVTAGVVEKSVPEDYNTLLAGFLEVQQPSGEEPKQLKEVYEWAQRQVPDGNEADILHAVKSLENRLRAPRLGQSRLSHLYQYTAIDNKVAGMTKLRDSL